MLHMQVTNGKQGIKPLRARLSDADENPGGEGNSGSAGSRDSG
jgi:hypothetical protein